jgi:hypothetical protein
LRIAGHKSDRAGEQRAEVVSSYLIACYAGISIPIVGIGVLSPATTPLVADSIFGAVIIAASVAALIIQLRVTKK